MESIFKRSESNPILTPEDLPFSAEAVLNPGVAELDGEVALLLRVEHTSGYSKIYVARSTVGVTDWQIDTKPFLEGGDPQWPYEAWGCEDPRVVYIEEQKQWYITYTAYSSAGAAVGLARTKDFVDVERIGLIFSPNNKDACLFPQRFDGKWAVVHRPDAGGGVESVWLSYSPDLIHWGDHHCVLREGTGPAWDAVKVGAGPPPVMTKKGWLMLYHGVKMYAGQLAYRVGAALLDKNTPHKLLGRSHECIFKAEMIYEQTGLIPNIVFPSGLLIRGDHLWMYYGASDTVVCLATAPLDDILASIEPVRSTDHVSEA